MAVNEILKKIVTNINKKKPKILRYQNKLTVGKQQLQTLQVSLNSSCTFISDY